MHLFLKGWIYKLNILFNYMGTDGAGRLIALSLAKAMKKNKCNVYAVLSANVAGNEEWISEFGKKNICFVTNYQNKNKIDFAVKTLKFPLWTSKYISNFFGSLVFDFVLRPMYHHWAHMIENAINYNSVITICHNPEMHSDEKQYLRYLYKKHICQSDKVIVLTKSYIPLIEREYGYPVSRIKYVPLGLMDEYDKYISHPLVPPYDESCINFLFFGLIRRYKGLHVLIRAFKKVFAIRNSITLRIIGAGDLEEYSKELSDLSNVYIENRYVDDSEVSSIFSGPNVVVVLPYIDACQSGVIQVAYQYENTIIASDVSVLKEQLDEGNIGIFFKVEDEEDLANKMIEVIDNPKLREKQRELIHLYKKKLDWKKIALDIITFAKG